MTKRELIAEITNRTGLHKRDVNRTLAAAWDVIREQLVAGDTVAVAGFGTFLTRERRARPGRNPRTGATFQIKAGRGARFRAGKRMRDALTTTTTDAETAAAA